MIEKYEFCMKFIFDERGKIRQLSSFTKYHPPMYTVDADEHHCKLNLKCFDVEMSFDVFLHRKRPGIFWTFLAHTKHLQQQTLCVWHYLCVCFLRKSNAIMCDDARKEINGSTFLQSCYDIIWKEFIWKVK